MNLSTKIKDLAKEVETLESENAKLKSKPINAVPDGTILSLHLNEAQTHSLIRALDYLVKQSQSLRQFNPAAIDEFQSVAMFFDFTDNLKGVLRKPVFDRLRSEVEAEKKEVDLIFEKWNLQG